MTPSLHLYRPSSAPIPESPTEGADASFTFDNQIVNQAFNSIERRSASPGSPFPFYHLSPTSPTSRFTFSKIPSIQEETENSLAEATAEAMPQQTKALEARNPGHTLVPAYTMDRVGKMWQAYLRGAPVDTNILREF